MDKLAEMYGSSVKAGLSTDRYRVLKDYYGVNKLPEPPKPSIPKMILSQVLDFMIIVLIIVAAVEAGLGDYDACGIIFAVVVMNVVIGFSQEYKANQALEALMSLSVQKVIQIHTQTQTHVYPGFQEWCV